MSSAEFPLWVDVLISVLVLTGGAFALLGSANVLRLPDFFQRLHAPALGASMGSACVVGGAIVYFSFKEGQLIPQSMAIVLFLAMTTPMVTIFLARAALFRERIAGKRALPTTHPDPAGDESSPSRPQELK